MIEIAISLFLVFAGLALGPLVRWFEERDRKGFEFQTSKKVAMGFAGVPNILQAPKPRGSMVLLAFVGIVLAFGAFTAIREFAYIRSRVNDLIFFSWLFLTMVFGMFAHVISETRKQQGPAHRVTVGQLLYPTLFSIVVFYPVWGVSANAPRNFFAFYAAFLNGYFWDMVVASAKPPAAAEGARANPPASAEGARE